MNLKRQRKLKIKKSNGRASKKGSQNSDVSGIYYREQEKFTMGELEETKEAKGQADAEGAVEAKGLADAEGVVDAEGLADAEGAIEAEG